MDDDLSDSSENDSGNEESEKKSSDQEIKTVGEGSKTKMIENTSEGNSVSSANKHEVTV